MRTLVPLAAVHLLLGTACLSYPWDDAILYQALDYRIDRPRVLAVAARPPALRAGQPVTLEALVLGPGGEASDATWSTCGLSDDQPTWIWGLDCFADDLDVSQVATGLPATWVVPGFERVVCTADTGWQVCEHSLPFLIDSSVGGEPVQGTFAATIALREEETAESPSLRDVDLQLTWSEAPGGEVALEAWLARPAILASFRWYVDEGTLLDTGRTAVQGERDGGVYTTNRWVRPDGAGPLRVVVVVGGAETWWGEDTGAQLGYASAPDMTWVVEQVP